MIPLNAVADSTARLLDRLDGVDVAAPSLLPGWTIGHVLTHIARNADGSRRMLEGAARGEVLDSYPGGAPARARAIEEGASRLAGEIVEDVRTTAATLATAMETLPPDAWSRTVRTMSGERPASEIPRRRRREVEVHHADLGLAYRPTDWPPDMVSSELEAAVAGLGPRLPLGTAIRIVTTETRDAWEVGAGPASVAVSGAAAWLLAWLLGRPVPVGALHAPAGLPTLRSWG